MGKKTFYHISSSDTHEVHVADIGVDPSDIAEKSFTFDRRWFEIMWVTIALLILVLGARVLYLSVVRHEHYAFVASGNTQREVPIIAPRGRIYAQDGELLADNEPRYALVLSHEKSEVLTSDDDGYDDFRDDVSYISTFFHLPEDFVRISLAEAHAQKQDIVLKEHLTPEENVGYKSAQRQVPGFLIEKNASRFYPDGDIFAHIIGYEGLIQKKDFAQLRENGYILTDRIGKTGLELQYESVLHGKHGIRKETVDSSERSVRLFQDVPAIPGRDLHTHIDGDLQRVLTYRLEAELASIGTRRGAAIVLDPRSGAVRALVSLPRYDNNAFVQGIDTQTYTDWITDEDRPLFNRAIAGAYPPGSTVKPMMGVATLMEGIVGPDYQIESKGGISVGQSYFGDWKVHGFTDLRRAIAVSSDVYFYTVGGGYGGIAGLGIARMHTWMSAFGFGEKTGIDLPSEVSGTYPTPEIKQELIGERWFTGDTYNASIGQGFVNASALHVANATAAVANGGTLYTPHVVSYAESPDGEQDITLPKPLRTDIATPDVMRIVQEGMRATVTEGTGRSLRDVPVDVAGKTGTSQFSNKDAVHSWFAAYAPYDDPEVVLVVLVEGQPIDISSSTMPVARDVLNWHFGGRDESSEWLKAPILEQDDILDDPDDE